MFFFFVIVFCSCFTFKQMSFVSCYLVPKVVVFYKYYTVAVIVAAAVDMYCCWWHYCCSCMIFYYHHLFVVVVVVCLVVSASLLNCYWFKFLDSDDILLFWPFVIFFLVSILWTFNKSNVFSLLSFKAFLGYMLVKLMLLIGLKLFSNNNNQKILTYTN